MNINSCHGITRAITSYQQRLLPLHWVGLFLGLLGITLVLQGNMEWQDTSNQYTAYLFAFIAFIALI
ncbi:MULTISPECIES: hypothetical protein [unclassified Aliivibrio]|uniref:hypothetical protein n=1 Tax=unclassified Aliivibrio TaxID=2645654 RepID=UPI000AB038FD|nr:MULTISPECIES: hypothetical protein [unclassified Aliivibrio]